MFLCESVAMGWGLEEGKQESWVWKGMAWKAQMKPVVRDWGGTGVLQHEV